MKRIIFDVPRWHAYLHRDARGLEIAKERDAPARKFEDELFDRIYSGETESLPESQQDKNLREWATTVHLACEQLPAFARLASECRGDATATATAVEELMAELQPQLPPDQDRRPPETIRRGITRACERASAAVDEVRETMEGLTAIGMTGTHGTATATGGHLPAHSIRALAARLKSDARLRQIALLAGRFKRIAAAKRRQKVKHGADELADVELGAELGRLLPSELVKLTARTHRALLLKDLLERKVMQYQLIGNEPLGRGPLVVLLDKSGSMEGPRDIWGTAVALALLDEAQRARRVFALIGFDYHVKNEAVVRPGEPLPEEALFTACAGGTEIAVALNRGLELIRCNGGPLKKADIVLITDGGSDTSSAAKLHDDAAALGVSILGFGIGVEREWLTPWCDTVQVVHDLTKLSDTSADSLFAA